MTVSDGQPLDGRSEIVYELVVVNTNMMGRILRIKFILRISN